MLCIGTSLVFGPILGKSWRLYKVFTQRVPDKRVVSKQQVHTSWWQLHYWLKAREACARSLESGPFMTEIAALHFKPWSHVVSWAPKPGRMCVSTIGIHISLNIESVLYVPQVSMWLQLEKEQAAQRDCRLAQQWADSGGREGEDKETLADKQLFLSPEPDSFPGRRPISALRRMGLEQWARERTPTQQIESTLEAMWQQITCMSLISVAILTTFPYFFTFPDRAAQTQSLSSNSL